MNAAGRQVDDPGMVLIMSRSFQSFIGLFVTVLSLVALAQDKPPQEQTSLSAEHSPITVKTTSRLVVVDVVVTDSHDRPVTGLTADNFVLREDGKVQKFSSFEEHSMAPPESSSAAANSSKDEKAAEHRFSNIPTATSSGALNVVLLDALNTLTADQLRVRTAMLQTLENLPQGQPVAVFTLNASLRMIHGFDGDREALRRSVEKVLASPSLAKPSSMDTQAEKDELIRLEREGYPRIEDLKQFLAEQASRQLDLRVQITLQALRELSRAVSGYPGRKNLIWISGAFPFTVRPNGELKDQFAVVRNYADETKETATMLSAAQIAVYAIDPGGLTHFGPNADSSGLSVVGLAKGNSSRYENQLSQQRDSVVDAQSTMNELAKETGGHAFYNSNDITAAVARSVNQGSSYYTIAYKPENNQWDGKFREIAVKLDHAKGTISYRRGYYAFAEGTTLTEEQKQRDMLLAMQRHSPIMTALKLGAEIMPAQSPGKIKIQYYLDPLQFGAATDDSRDLEIFVVAVAWGEDGTNTGHEVQTVRIAAHHGLAAQLQRSNLQVNQVLTIKPGASKVRIGIMDEHTGRIGTLDCLLVAQAPAPPGR